MLPGGFLGKTLLDPGLPGAPAPREELHQAIQRAAALGEPSTLEVAPLLGGAEGMFEFRVVPERDAQGKVARVLVLARDVSERRRLERQMRDLNQELEHRVAQRTAQYEAANRELEAFAYSVSHDLRAPLRHVDGFLDLLGKHLEGTLDERGRSYLTAVSSAARRMGQLIDDLLSFARMGRAELSRSRVELGPLLEEVRGELALELEDREVRWRIGPLPAVSGDRAMLRVALSNLLANAVKFTRPRHPAQIEVGALREVPGEAVLFVRDNGVGFDPAYGHKLFGVFQRLHRTDEFEGTGIGLANVRRIVARHGGRTWAEGAVGEGATFFIALPEAPPERVSDLPVRATAGAAAGRSR
jgi:light-regulated signal transduction histidine kinase (bacteriophytochrome)